MSNMATVAASARQTCRRGDVTICYEIAGTGPAVACIQGVGVAGEGWRPQVDALASRYRMVTFDNRGIGASSPQSGVLRIEDMARDTIAIMDQEGIERFHVVGHSMGGLIAQQVALLVPARVKSLALLCTFANGADATKLSARMLVLGIRSRVGTRAMRRNAMLDMVMPPDYLRGVNRPELAARLQQLFGRDLADQPPIITAQLRAMSKTSVVDRLKELPRVPTLVVSGAHDPISPPAVGRAIAAAIPGARFVELPHASHALTIHCADEINAMVLEHLASAEQAGATV